MRLRSKARGAAILATAACTAISLAAVPASAQTQASSQPPAAKAKDPSRIICEKVEETGSRLSAKRVCMTAQQWQDKRRSDREYVEDSQQRSLEPTSG